MSDVDIFIEDHCKKMEWDGSNKILYNNLFNYYYAEQRFKWGGNDLLISNYDIMTYSELLTAPKAIGCLIGLYSHERSNTEISYHGCSGQVAKTAQTLRDNGFTFNKFGKANNRYIDIRNGEVYREIVGFDPSTKSQCPNWNKLNNKEIVILKIIFCKDIIGISFTPRDGEIDHRIPEAARKKMGIIPAHLTLESLKDGSWSRNFQILSKKSNNMKRQACDVCMNNPNKLIPLPPSVEIYRSIYRKSFEEDSTCCNNCFWSNNLNPKVGFNIPNLLDVINEYNEKLEEVKIRIYKLYSL